MPHLETHPEDFDWNKIEPRSTLEYHPCFSDFLCARLAVPLNWNTTAEEREDGPQAAIAVIKLPAEVPITDPRYGGPILFNPGGPGESGVFQVKHDGKDLRTLLDSPLRPEDAGPDARFFDMIGFDPRGVNNTTPALKCFPNAFKQQAWSMGYLDYGLLWDSDSITGYEYARAAALGAGCSQEEADGGMLRYMNTAQVVEDMVEIIEREGELRALEAERLLASPTTAALNNAARAEVAARTAYIPGEEKLQYWGMSYGTVIGSMFAALHPDKVGRVAIDGVVDPADHVSGGWLTQLQDSDKIVGKFSEYCFEAGPEKCPLYLSTSPADIEARFTNIMVSLREMPIPVPTRPLSAATESMPGPELITYGDAHLRMLGSLYFPYASAERFWDLLWELEARNATAPIIVSVAAGKQASLSPAECADPLSSLPCVPYNSMLGPNQAIGCMDAGGSRDDFTLSDFKEYLGVLKGQGRWISPSWSRNKIGCLGYTVRPAWRPELDFKAQAWANTSHPLLVISNTHDTVTPLRNGRRVASLFPGSVVLQQDSQGHCSHSSPSLCSARTIRHYFQTGELPEEGTVCTPDYRPFLGCIRDDGCQFKKGSEERDLWDAVEALADPWNFKSKD
ncbi:TAP-like protein-domain-containing protein [Xylariales sp. PMI_506]|nr:TAP-like protein-domain-containing protein [Xylariales sp. PMI_506]